MSLSTDVTFDNAIESDVSFLDPLDVNLGPVTIDGIPSNYTFHTYLEKIPKITIGVGPLHVSVDHVPKMSVESDLNVRLTEIPSVRTHLPANYSVGLSVLGVELLCLRLCGEGQIITEPYVPNPCERCGTPAYETREAP